MVLLKQRILIFLQKERVGNRLKKEKTEEAKLEEKILKSRKPISISARKAKGRRLQQWAAKKIAEITGFEYGPDCEISSRPMGQSGTDVRMERQVLDLFPYSIECKAQENWAVPAWVEQARKNTYPGTEWLLVFKRNQERPLVILDAEHFFNMMGKLVDYVKEENNV